MTISNQSTSFKEWFMKKVGFELVAENQVVPILHDKRVGRICSQGYFWYNHLTEEPLPAIDIGFRTTKVALTARSLDQIEIRLDFTIGFLFDPRKAHVSMASQLTQAVARSGDTLHQIIRTVASQAARLIVGDLSAKKLCSGQAVRRLERSLHHSIPPRLMMYGIRIPNMEEAITVLNIQIPEAVNNANQFTRIRALMAENSALAAAETERWLLQSKQLEQIASGGNMIYMIGEPNGQVKPESMTMSPIYPPATTTNGKNKGHEANEQQPGVTWDILQPVPRLPNRKRTSA